MQTLGIGIIGYDFMGKVHANNHRSLPIHYEPAPVRTKLVGVADAAPERVRLAVDVVGGRVQYWQLAGIDLGA